jgi:GNAT superfamily N-acetyltransferase
MSELSIREMEQDEDFAEWFDELLSRENEEYTSGEHYLVLTSEIGDWIGGLRYQLRGGVASLIQLAIAPEHREHGHAIKLLDAFDERAKSAGAHLLEFSTDDARAERRMVSRGWTVVGRRPDHIGHRNWALLERRLRP